MNTKFNYKQFPITHWSTVGFDTMGPHTITMWKDLGITLGIIPETKPEEKEAVLAFLDLVAENGMKTLIRDPRTAFMTYLALNDEDAFRRGVKEAVKDFGSHPAIFGFYIGDEPNSTQRDAAFRASAIVREEAPELVPFLNFYPWNPVYGPNMSEYLQVSDLQTYLDNYVKECNPAVISYDCYTACLGKTMADSFNNHGINDYFFNLHEFYLASKRHGVPFNTCINCFEHSWYRCTETDMRWQLSTAVACGASMVTWFIIQLSWVMDNWRNAAINHAGQRTETFDRLARTNRMFSDYCGKVIPQLTIDECYHVNRAFGGFPLFEPFGNVLDITCKDEWSKEDIPAIISRYHDAYGRVYYGFCCVGETGWATADIRLKPGVTLERCQVNNRFEPCGLAVDTITQEVIEGQSPQKLHINTYCGQFLLFREG